MPASVWGSPIAGESTVHRRGLPIAVRVLIADAVRTAPGRFTSDRVSRGSKVAATRGGRSAGAILEVSSRQRVKSLYGPRLYIDFTQDADYAARLEQLIREIHGASSNSKPPLGSNPFT